MPTLKSLTPETRSAPGAFLPDGSWNEAAELHHRGHVHRLVSGLVRDRRTGHLTPARAAQAIQAANASGAFPNVAQWAGCDAWVSAHTATSAEECVRREGRGASGHWCGPQRWLAGSERECPELRHHVTAQPEHASAALDVLMAIVGSRSECGATNARYGARNEAIRT